MTSKIEGTNCHLETSNECDLVSLLYDALESAVMTIDLVEIIINSGTDKKIDSKIDN